MSAPEHALEALAAEVRGEGSVISPHVVKPSAEPALGVLVAAGPRTTQAPGEYARVIESVREGYLLHYGTPRIIATGDRDLALLAGDYMYASGLSLLASIGDSGAVAELAELISLCAQAHTDGAGEVPALWLAAAVAIAAGSAPEHVAAKAALRAGKPAGGELRAWATSSAARCGLDEELEAASKAVGFPR